jgi:hypothetical protein
MPDSDVRAYTLLAMILLYRSDCLLSRYESFREVTPAASIGMPSPAIPTVPCRTLSWTTAEAVPLQASGASCRVGSLRIPNDGFYDCRSVRSSCARVRRTMLVRLNRICGAECASYPPLKSRGTVAWVLQSGSCVHNEAHPFQAL